MATTNRKQFFKSFGLPEETSLSIEELSSLTGIPIDALQIVYNRGIGAWKTSPQSIRLEKSYDKDPTKPRKSKLSKEQWAFGRLYAFLNKSKKVYYGSDNDVREKYGLE